MGDRGVRVPYRVIDAGRGKLARAQPVAALYEQSPPHVRHVGRAPRVRGPADHPHRRARGALARPHGRARARIARPDGAVCDAAGGRRCGPLHDARRVPGGAVPCREGFPRSRGLVDHPVFKAGRAEQVGLNGPNGPSTRSGAGATASREKHAGWSRRFSG